MQQRLYDLVEPDTGEAAVIVEVPHAGLWIDPASMAGCVAPVRSIGSDADLYVDQLVEQVPEQGASLLVSRVSRYVVDLNRELDEYDSLSVAGGQGTGCPRGLIWRMTASDEPALRNPISEEELCRRLGSFYHPYHKKLSALLQRKRERFGGVVVLSLHSMPSVGKKGAFAVARADVVVGTRGQTTAAAGLVGLVDEHIRSYGWSVAHDDPYRGGATTGRLGHPAGGAHAIQIELARRLYMDETSLQRKDGTFDMVGEFCCGLVAKLGAAAVG
jgi:N-formylglutamate deformylase